MKIAFLLIALGSLAACAGSTHADSTKCPADQVCLTVWQEGDQVSFQITNNSKDMVTLPEFTGLGTPMGAHYIGVQSDTAGVNAPVSSGGFPLEYHPSDSVLRANGWIGFTLSAAGVRKIYRLSEGCQNITVTYRVNAEGDQYYRGAVQGVTQKVCL